MKNRFIKFHIIGIKIELIYLKHESYYETSSEKFEIVQTYLVVIN